VRNYKFKLAPGLRVEEHKEVMPSDYVLFEAFDYIKY
jgi:hypothetical protein